MDIKQASIDIAELIRDSIIMNFKKGGRPEKWKPSKRALGLHKSKADGKSRGGSTLIDTANLMNSINAESDGMEIGASTSIIYARIHDQGGKVKTGSKSGGPGYFIMPQRQFMMLQERDYSRITKILERVVVDTINKEE